MGFVTGHLGPALEQASLDTKIWILDHNYNLWGRVVDELSYSDVYKYVDGVAWHSYAGTPDAMSRVHEMFPAKDMYFTEGGPPAHLFAPRKHRRFTGFTFPPYGTGWSTWSSAFTDMLRNWARSFTVWNLVLDQNGRPCIAKRPRPKRPGGLISLNTKTQKLSYSGSYYAFPHFSKLIKRGAHIFASYGDLPGINHVAAENTDGTRALVLTNTNATLEQHVQCTLASRALNIALPPESITSLFW